MAGVWTFLTVELTTFDGRVILGGGKRNNKEYHHFILHLLSSGHVSPAEEHLGTSDTLPQKQEPAETE